MTTRANPKGLSDGHMQMAYGYIESGDIRRAQMYVAMALVFEQRRAANALEGVLEKLNNVIIDRGVDHGFVRIESDSLGRDC